MERGAWQRNSIWGDMELKKLFVGVLVLTIGFCGAQAGPVATSSKQIQQTANAPRWEDFYRDREWNLDLFGAYAFTGTPYRNDRYLEADHAWGGGIAGNYFFTRYLGAGLQGYALDADDIIGQTAGNLIFRYPIPGTRVAPYGFAGGGVLFNGSRAEDLVDRGHNLVSVTRHSDVEGMGEFGGGFEVRITPHIGIRNDFSWNVVNGGHNNYGIVRTGLSFAF